MIRSILYVIFICMSNYSHIKHIIIIVEKYFFIRKTD